MVNHKREEGLRLRIEEEKAHFDELFKKRKSLAWFYRTRAGKKRLERRGRLVAKKIFPEAKVLELGSGLGGLTYKLAKTKAKITAVEITPALVREARTRIKDKNVTFYQADIHQLPFKDETFDLGVGNSILHHLDLSKALGEIRRVLRNGGKIIFFEPNLLNPQVFLQKKIGFLKKFFEESPWETAFFRWQLKKNLERAGFFNVSVTPFDFLHPLTPSIFIGLVERISPFLEKTPLLKELSGSLLIKGQA